MYRNAVYRSYALKPDLATDIRECANNFELDSDHPEPAFAQIMAERSSEEKNLYQYAVPIVISTLKDLQNPDSKTQCYLAYSPTVNGAEKVGMILF